MEPVTNSAAIRTEIDAATLDAFADGALSPEEAARVVLHLADCPGDQAYVDAVMETNALLAAAYAAPLHQALPERLRATIFPAEAAPAGRGTARRGRPVGLARPGRTAVWGALAASAVLAVGLAASLAPGRNPARDAIAGLPGADAALRAALESSPSGAVAETVDGATITVIASFLGDGKRPCREFEVEDAAAMTEGVACRDATGGWITEIAVASRLPEPQARRSGFVTASGAGDDALDATLDRLGAGMLLTPDEESALIASGWAP